MNTLDSYKSNVIASDNTKSSDSKEFIKSLNNLKLKDLEKKLAFCVGEENPIDLSLSKPTLREEKHLMIEVNVGLGK